jgi:hypothetical protein
MQIRACFENSSPTNMQVRRALRVQEKEASAPSVAHLISDDKPFLQKKV